MTEGEFSKLEKGRIVAHRTGTHCVFIKASGNEVKIKATFNSTFPSQLKDGTIITKKETFMRDWEIVSAKTPFGERTRRVYPFSP